MFSLCRLQTIRNGRRRFLQSGLIKLDKQTDGIITDQQNKTKANGINQKGKYKL